MRESIRFLLGHEPREIRAIDPNTTVLDWLRTTERRCGTKEGCAEGDCGACTVVLARPENGRLRYEAVNACIQLVPMLDGLQLVTVEDLAGPAGALHPVQEAMVETHASQCGFCTPGFVMSLFALFRNEPRPSDDSIDDVLAGNLCRCTGYGPIVEAARRLYDRGPRDGDRFAAREPETLRALKKIRDAETVRIDAAGRSFFSPATADALAAIMMDNPDARIVAGATDVGLWITKQLRGLETIVHVGRVAELQRIAERDDAIEIGAAVTYTDAMEVLARHYPDMGELFRRLGSVQIRNVGTIGGNIANGSPIGDSMPPLIAAGATLHLRRGDARRAMPLEDFFVAYGKQDRQPGEWVERIEVPKPRPGTRFRCYKISKRFDQDISAVCGAFALRMDDGKVAEARIAYGGMAATPKRASGAEAALTGLPWDRDAVEAAMAALDDDFEPLTDMRASAGYRSRIARNLLLKCFIETTGTEAGTRVAGDPELARV